MKLTELFQQGAFVVTGEVGPPKGASAEEVIAGAKAMASAVDAVNVTCRDRNRIALQSDLLSAAALGVSNVLLLTGDHMVLGDHPGAKAVFDLDSVQLLAAARGLNEGHDLEDHDLEASPDLCLGAVVNPGSDDLDARPAPSSSRPRRFTSRMSSPGSWSVPAASASRSWSGSSP